MKRLQTIKEESAGITIAMAETDSAFNMNIRLRKPSFAENI